MPEVWSLTGVPAARTPRNSVLLANTKQNKQANGWKHGCVLNAGCTRWQGIGVQKVALEVLVGKVNNQVAICYVVLGRCWRVRRPLRSGLALKEEEQREWQQRARQRRPHKALRTLAAAGRQCCHASGVMAVRRAPARAQPRQRIYGIPYELDTVRWASFCPYLGLGVTPYT